MPSKQLETTYSFIESMRTLDIDAALSLRTPDSIYSMAPASAGLPASMTNTQWAEHITNLAQVLVGFDLSVKEIFETEDQVVLWATSKVIFKNGAKGDEEGVDWSYDGEYLILILFDGEGKKIKRVVEFLDSKPIERVRGLLERAGRNLAAKAESAH